MNCPYCGKKAELLKTSKSVYHGKDYGPVYICQPCQAWVGVHKGTLKPLGRLADAELRKAKQKAHSLFDPLWQRKMKRDGCKKQEARRSAYLWLSGKLGIDTRDCHIGMFDVKTCERVVEICKPF